MTGIEKIVADLEWRGPNGKAMGHVVLTRTQAERVLIDLKHWQQIASEGIAIERELRKELADVQRI